MENPIGGTLLLFSLAGPLVLSGQKAAGWTSQRAVVPLDGPKIFRNYCAACHGVDGKGKGPVADALNHAPPDLTSISQRNGGKFPADEVKAIIAGQEKSTSAHGSREMPVWGPIFHDVEWDQDLGEVRLENVTRYVESLQQK